jgi:hypothetical protein
MVCGIKINKKLTVVIVVIKKIKGVTDITIK